MAEEKKLDIFPIIMLAGAGISGYFLYKYLKEKEGYPKSICRNPYCFDVYNEEEEKQVKEFLGIYPQGEDIDTYLSKLAQADLDYWKNYWIDIWTNLGRSDIISFVNEMYEKYSGVGAVSARIDNFAISV